MRDRWRRAALVLAALLIASCWLGPQVVLQAQSKAAAACRVTEFASTSDSAHFQVDCAKPTPATVRLAR